MIHFKCPLCLQVDITTKEKALNWVCPSCDLNKLTKDDERNEIKKYFVCVALGNEGVIVKADWFEYNTCQLEFYQGKIYDEDDSITVAVFNNWEYFIEVQEDHGR